MKLMLIEDDYLLNKAIKNYLESKGFMVTSFLDGLAAVDTISVDYDLYIIDIDIPEIKGIEILEEIRKNFSEIPVIMISATIDINMISKAYDTGCNDYLKKPFDIKELEIKINQYKKEVSNRLDLGNEIFYDMNSKILYHHDQEIQLTKQETQLVALLVLNRTRYVSNETIEYTIWGLDANSSYLRQLVNRLRKKIPHGIIENKIGEGYIIR